MTSAVLESSPTMTVERKKLRPVVGWAVLGAIFLGFEIYLLASWILSGEAVRQPVGATPVPMYMKVFLNIMQVAIPLGFVAAAYFFLIRPWRRAGHVTTDGLFVFAFALLFWQDPLPDFVGPWALYNTYPVNFGSWGGNLPGITFPHAERLAEPIFLTVPCFLGAVFLQVVAVNFLMRKAQQRWPTLSNFRLIAGVFVAFFFIELVGELFSVGIGYYTFPGAQKAWSLFPGSTLRFPMYEAIFMTAAYVLFTFLRYFKNDRGETYAERGSEQLRTTGWRKSGTRFLAIFGVVNLIFLASYVLPMAYFSLNMDNFPKTITSKSYLMGGGLICGKGTTYKCPGPKVPIPRGNSAHVGPDGKLVPAGDGQSTTVGGSR